MTAAIAPELERALAALARLPQTEDGTIRITQRRLAQLAGRGPYAGHRTWCELLSTGRVVVVLPGLGRRPAHVRLAVASVQSPEMS